jgi:flagellar protein FliO/FliZ
MTGFETAARQILAALKAQPQRWMALKVMAWLSLAGFGLLALTSLLPGGAPASAADASGLALSGPAIPEPGTGNLIAATPLDTLGMLFSVTFKLALVLLLAYVCLLVFKRWRGRMPGLPARQLQLLETTRLSARQAVHLVKVGEQTLLIGATDQNISLLVEVDPDGLTQAASAPATSAAAPADFGNWLSRAGQALASKIPAAQS